LERVVQPDVGVAVGGIGVKVKKRSGSPGEVTAFAFSQLGELA